jgi:hypothetical protein
MIATTIIRLSGLINKGVVDALWTSYWNVISAEVGIFMAAAIAFRSLFVANSKSKAPQDPPKRYFGDSFLRVFHRKKSSTWDESQADATELPRIPRAQLTGMRSFIDAQGRSRVDPALPENEVTEDHTDTAPLRTYSGHMV